MAKSVDGKEPIPDARRARIRSLAGGLARQEVSIEIEPEDDPASAATSAPPPVAPVAETPKPTPPKTAQMVKEKPAPPSPTPTPKPAPAPVSPSTSSAPPAEEDALPQTHVERKINMKISDATTLRQLDEVERILNNARTAQGLKGQLGATLLFKMGMALLATLEKDELYARARASSSYATPDEGHHGD